MKRSIVVGSLEVGLESFLVSSGEVSDAPEMYL